MFEESENFFPAKPELVQPEQGSRYGRLLISMVLFFVVLILIVPENYLLAFEIMAILFLHEAGHLIMMKLYGYRSVNMLFIPLFGAMVSGSKNQVSQRQRVLISLMGPLPGIILGCVFLVISGYQIQSEPVILVELGLLLVSINILNLIPLDPLDGGHIIETLFFPSNDQVRMYFTLGSSLLIILGGFYFGFIPLIVIGFLMAFKVRAFQKNKVIHDDLDEMDLNYKKPYSELSDREYWTIRRVFLENNPKIKEIIPEDGTLWENEKLLVEQINQLLRANVIPDLSKAQRFLFLGILLAGIVLPLLLLAGLRPLLEWYIAHVGL